MIGNLTIGLQISNTEAWPEPEILQSLIAKLPWCHNLRALDRIKDRPTREWYLSLAKNSDLRFTSNR
jgi:hypothetical protein